MTNFLLITADQWRGDCLGAVGHGVMKTPNADRLAAEGTLFRRHFTQATPCAPARACLYTGLYQMTNRVVCNGTPLDDRHDNIARALRRGGYDPTLFGYTDQGIDPRTTTADDPRLLTYEGVLPGLSVRLQLPEHAGQWLSWLAGRGYDTPADVFDIYRPARDGNRRGGRIGNAAPIYTAEETETAFLTNEFLRWVSEQPAGKPWCAHLSFLRPHPPYTVPEPYNTFYDPADGPPFRRHASAAEEQAQHPLLDFLAEKLRISDKLLPGAGEGRVADLGDDDFRTVRAVYWGMVSEVDHQLGRLWAGLEAAGAWDDTLIVLTSDHGEQLGDHWTLNKFGYFDQSYFIPLIIRDPSRPGTHGISVDAFTEAVDVMPTVLEALGLPVPGHLDGESLVPFLDGRPPARWRDAVHWEFDFRDVVGGVSQRRFGLDLDQCSMAVHREERFKYVHFTGLPPVLFDLREDPDELVNRADDPAYVSVRIEMAEKLASWRARHLDRRMTGIMLTEEGVIDGRRQ